MRRAPRHIEDETPDRVTSTLPQPTGPLLLMISLGKQRIAVYDGNQQITTAPISSGTRSNPTPTGIFSIIEKNRYHYSNLYDGAPMPFMQRITWSGVALHAGHLPGYPASHGCIRLPYSFARNLFGVTGLGARVVVTDEDLAPKPFESNRLIAPLPPDDAGNTPSLVASVAGVTPAAAEVVDRPRTRGTAAAARAAERVRLGEAVAAAETSNRAAAERVRSATEAARAARAAAGKARAEAGRLAEAARKAARTAAAAESRFADLMARKVKLEVDKLNGAELEAEAEKELAEEAKTLDLADAAQAAQAAADVQAQAAKAAATDADAAETARKAAIEATKQAEQALADAQAALAAAERFETHQHLPVSVFVSARTGRLYARLGFEPVLEVPVKIADPGTPLGTHLFTAVSYGEGQRSLNWNVVSMAGARAEPAPPSRRGRRRSPDGLIYVSTGVTPPPASALERIEMPKEAAEKLAEVMKPGSSFLISDYGPSRETGKGTDFIVEPWRN